MFRVLTQVLVDAAKAQVPPVIVPREAAAQFVLAGQPDQLVAELDLVSTFHPRLPDLGVTSLEEFVRREIKSAVTLPVLPPLVFPHLIYAYLIENTGILGVFRAVLEDVLHDERLSPPTQAVMEWVRNTEDLFYSDVRPDAVFSLRSRLRPDDEATRRNAYFRMFGSDLIHGSPDGTPYPYRRAEVANSGFRDIFERLLREAWRGFSNYRNTTGPNDTDDQAIANLATQLSAMMANRRINGQLSREEFVAVSTLSWFHLAIEFDSPIVIFLQAQAATAAGRLEKIARRVGAPMSAHAHHFFEMADAASRLCLALENQNFNRTLNAPALYHPNSAALVPAPAVATQYADSLSLITHWSAASGRNLKQLQPDAAEQAALPARAA